MEDRRKRMKVASQMKGPTKRAINEAIWATS